MASEAEEGCVECLSTTLPDKARLHGPAASCYDSWGPDKGV